MIDDPSLEGQDAIDIDSGTLSNFADGIIRSTTNAAIDFDPGANSSQIYNYGLIQGTVAVNTDDADSAAQLIVNKGEIIGTSGVALNLGQGDDSVFFNAGTISGDVLMGSGQDFLSFDADFAFTAGLFANGGVLDGGDGYDVLDFEGRPLSDVLGLSSGGNPDEVFIDLIGGTRLRTTGFEAAQFSGGSLDLSTAPVPLPAGGVLLLTGAGAMAVLRKRKARVKSLGC